METLLNRVPIAQWIEHLIPIQKDGFRGVKSNGSGSKYYRFFNSPCQNTPFDLE